MTMAYWLVKSEPSTWSWDQQVAKGAKGEAWTGVRNFTARQNLVAMKKGDKAFFYHSNEGKEIVGIAEIVKEAYPDPTDKTEKFVCVDIKADKPLKTPVTLVPMIITAAAENALRDPPPLLFDPGVRGRKIVSRTTPTRRPPAKMPIGPEMNDTT
mgnify:CR=1 FL=1